MKSKAVILNEAKTVVSFIYALQNSELRYSQTDAGKAEIAKAVASETIRLNTLLWVLEMTPEDVGV
jgi:hypothetical protein